MGTDEVPSNRYLWTAVKLEDPKPVEVVRLAVPPLAMLALDVSTTVPADCLLVCEPPPTRGTFTYAGRGYPVPNPDQYLEATMQGDSVTIEHFGAGSTPGVTTSNAQQLFVNASVVSDSVDRRVLFYLLKAPQVTVDYLNGHVARTWNDPGHPTRGGSLIRGFNVYLDGISMSDTPVGPTVRGATVGLGGIRQGSWVVVTVVDHHGNKWPHPQPPARGLEGEWRGFVTTQAAADATRGLPGFPSLGSRVELKIVFERPLPDGKIPSTLEYASPMNGQPMRIGMAFTRKDNTLAYDMDASGVHGHWEGIIRPDPSGRGDTIEGAWNNTMGQESAPGFFFVEGAWEVRRVVTPAP